MTRESRPTAADGVRTLLAAPRFEVLPFDGVGDQLDHLPDGATVAITTSPTLGLEATVEWSERAAERGFAVVPHLAARYVRDKAHLEDIARRLTEAGVNDVFVPGGDRDEPVGAFDSAYELLRALDRSNYAFEEVGITGYPEGHAFLDDRTLEAAMERKAPYATYLVSQICFDPEAIVAWIEAIRARGVELPVEVGVPGVMSTGRLLSVSRRVGVGESVRFLRKTTGILGFVRRVLGSRGTYTPEKLLDGLAPYAEDPEYAIRGLHVYTFNRAAETEDWRRRTIEIEARSD